MSEESANSESNKGDEIDPGEPIGELASFEHPPSTNFLSRVRRALQRRTTVSQIASFSWNTPFLVLMEFWLMLIQPLNPKGPRKDRPQ